MWIDSYGPQREMRNKSLPSGQTSSMGGALGHNDQKCSPSQAATGGGWDAPASCCLRAEQFTLAAGLSRSRSRGHAFILTWWSGLAAGGLFNDCFIELLRLLDDETST